MRRRWTIGNTALQQLRHAGHRAAAAEPHGCARGRGHPLLVDERDPAGDASPQPAPRPEGHAGSQYRHQLRYPAPVPVAWASRRTTPSRTCSGTSSI